MEIFNLNKQWYVLYVNVRHEKKVFEKFVEQGIESYVPIVKNVKQWSDRKKTVEEPLFTGYVFAKLLPHELDKPRYVAGVINYLSFGKQKATVKQSEIDSLKYLIEKGYSLSTNSENIQVGAKVKLLLSAFKDEVATVQSIKDENAVVYFESLNQFIKVKTPVSALQQVK
ncbi:MAG: UpxY family transcription antiterminator [Bacteroidetes bacterium]|nr:UpxY family transcription antiterminator [Bacteroidota bacterium]